MKKSYWTVGSNRATKINEEGQEVIRRKIGRKTYLYIAWNSMGISAACDFLFGKNGKDWAAAKQWEKLMDN